MSKPTPEELAIALAEAARLREHGIDEHFIGKSLLNLNYRMYYLEKVMIAAKEYLNTGLGAREQIDLIHAIAKADKTYINKSDIEENHFL